VGVHAYRRGFIWRFGILKCVRSGEGLTSYMKCFEFFRLKIVHCSIGVARGAVGAPAPPGQRKNFRRNLQVKFVSAPQHTKCIPGRVIVNFRTFLRFGDGSG